MAEGAETALSVTTAHPDWTVYITFGVQNFEKVANKVASSSMVICADNGGVHSGTDKAVKKASQKIAEGGMEVWISMPDIRNFSEEKIIELMDRRRIFVVTNQLNFNRY